MRWMGWAAMGAVCLACGGGSSPAAPNYPGGGDSGAPQIIGRTAVEGQTTHFTLPGTEIHFHFRGSEVSVDLGDVSEGVSTAGGPFQDEYQVVVDGKPTTVIDAQEGEHTYSLAKGLPAGEHEVTLYKRTETMVGEGILYGYSLGQDGTLLAPSSRPQRRIEFIGDSITAGYGDEGKDKGCLFSPATEDAYLAFPALTARALGAEEIAVAYSGRGVIRNLDGSTRDTMPDLYSRALLDDPQSSWDFKQWVPQAVVIELGTNDFETGVPDETAFVQGYAALLRTVRGHYPKAYVFVALGPLLSDDYPAGARHLTLARQYLQKVVADAHQGGDAKVALIEFPALGADAPMGCEWHPNLATHQEMATQLASAIRAALGW